MLSGALVPRYSQSIFIEAVIALRIRFRRGTHGLKHLLFRSLEPANNTSIPAARPDPVDLFASPWLKSLHTLDASASSLSW